MTNSDFNRILKGKRFKVDLTLSDKEFINRINKILDSIGEERLMYLNHRDIEVFANQTMRRLQNIRKKTNLTLV